MARSVSASSGAGADETCMTITILLSALALAAFIMWYLWYLAGEWRDSSRPEVPRSADGGREGTKTDDHRTTASAIEEAAAVREARATAPRPAEPVGAAHPPKTERHALALGPPVPSRIGRFHTLSIPITS